MMTSPTQFTKKAIMPLLSLLILTAGIVPLATAASITVTTDKAVYNPSESLVVSGVATPNSAVTVKVYNPAMTLVGIGQGSTDEVGQYSVTVFTWPSTPTLDIPLGTYSITATDAANGEFAETTAQYALVNGNGNGGPEPIEGVIVQISVSTGSMYQQGDTARIFVLFSYNGEKIDPTARVFTIRTPGLSSIPRSLTRISTGVYYVDYTPTDLGTYAVQVEATALTTSNVEITTFQVVEKLATEAGLETLGNDIAENIADIGNDIASARSEILSRISSAQSSLEDAISSARDSVEDTINSAKDDIKSSISNINIPSVDLSSVTNAISNLDSKIGSAQSEIQSRISSSENSIKSQVTSSEQSVKSAINGIQSAVTTAVTSAVSPLSSDISQLSSDISSMQSNLESVESGVSAASTWILVVGIIAAITLVLELVIIIRKLS